MTRSMPCAALSLALLASAPAVAEPAVGDCDGWQSNARNVDFSQPSPTFAQGAIRLVALDTVDPVAAAFHLMVLVSGSGNRFCALVSANPEGTGFAGLDLSRVVSSFTPATGLTVTLPVTERLATGDSRTTPLLVLVDPSAPTVTATLLN